MRKVYFAIMFFSYMIYIALRRFKYRLVKDRLSKEEREEYLYDVINNWSKAIIRYSGLKVEVIGKENLPKETCLYVANHQSQLDIPLVMASIDEVAGAIAKKEIENWPIVSGWMKEFNCVFINREDAREGLKSILLGVQYLKDKRSMLIFPEGTRSKGHSINEFKKGSMKLAIKANVPVVPITVDGAFKGLEGKPEDLKAKIIFHKPIYIDKLTKDEQNNLAKICENIIASAL
ncbi:lysophospholipid acyltransferase family protein [Clostridium sp.]|uniref:lysophospholipid acyltransferase family protein n=1 Tax=Clostridium sp. TaxID=1506 RepID=UPI002FC78950